MQTKMSLRLLLICCTLLFPVHQINAAIHPDSLLPVRGLCIEAPRPSGVDSFVTFIHRELGPRKVNTLILRIDFNYQFKSHPELRDSIALSEADVKKMVTVCKQNNITLIPQINLLGHQSWASKTHNLLKKYPEFDETPWVKMPEKYAWPNNDSLYCKSYCSRHPRVHKIVFALVDEICQVFEANTFHAGMDEVFYIGYARCRRCRKKDKAQLFADEVWRIRNHLAAANRTLWIWGDRMLDGHATGMGMWEASHNGTHPSVDQVPKDIVVCDWHYERADKSAVYFAMKGFKVVTCPWRDPLIAIEQLQDMINFRRTATPQLKPLFGGMLQTIWSPNGAFLKEFYNKPQKSSGTGGKSNTQWECFTRLFDTINQL
ncbi:family 20 glycosylhydrolase [Niabella sp. CC-SYL272]|uniref:family 20 glycosylhydrolase n=1 Tax=Niabella agricola TaxID=2891571 RepID=UPI001F2B41EC|nr:family 20 glycosylhydrolase [Niabella agricola]MCF3111192.1 family 20 glycosylhydrolase [Niabella agricola]